METVKCNLCGSSNLKVAYSKPDEMLADKGFFTVVECLSCGMGFVNPRPAYEEMGSFYPAEYYDYHFEQDAEYHQRRYERESRFVEEVSREKGLLLDVGCANGGFPRYMMTRGWRVEGVEISSSSRAITDFKVYAEEFSKIPVNAPRYDAVTAWAVLEHVHDPMSYFRKAGEVLKGGGHFIFHVTNFLSLGSRHLYREDVPRHLYFYTEPAVKRYLDAGGLELVKADYSDRIFAMRPINWLHYYLRGPFEWKDIPLDRWGYFKARGLKPGLVSTLRFFAANPITFLDRRLLRVYEKYQMLTKQYGTVTYTARKR